MTKQRAKALAKKAAQLILKVDTGPEYWMATGVILEVINQAVEAEKKALRKALEKL